MTPPKLIFLITLGLYYSPRVLGQCSVAVPHLHGVQNVAGVSITVTPSGFVDTNIVTCADRYPFYIGIKRDAAHVQQPGTGRFTFEFSPAVESITLNIAGISSLQNAYEEVRIYKNNVHYAIPTQGTLNECGPMALLTAAGNMIGCAFCPVAGWDETILSGPIHSLAVEDTLFVGNPGGSIFSIFFCKQFASVAENKFTSLARSFYPNPFHEKTKLDASDLPGAEFLLMNAQGSQVKSLILESDGNIEINGLDLAPGLYCYIIISRNGTTTFGKIAKE